MTNINPYTISKNQLTALQSIQASATSLAGSVSGSLFQTNIADIGGNAPDIGQGATDTGTLRIAIANDDNVSTALTSAVSDLGSISTDTNTISSNTTLILEDTVALHGCVINNTVSTGIQYVRGTLVDQNSGTLSNGTQRVCIATDDVNLSSINTNASTLAGAITSSKIQSNVAQINGVAPSMGSGVNGTGVQRTTIATDDNVSTTLTTIASSTNFADSGAHEYQAGVTVGGVILAVANEAHVDLGTTDTNFSGVGVDHQGSVYTDIYKINDTNIAVNSGNLSGGVQRVCIASNDVNLSALAGTVGVQGSGTYTAATSTGILLGGVRNDNSLTTLAGTNGQFCPLGLSAVGNMMCRIQSINGNTPSTNSGTTDGGTLRVCIATDDNISSKLSTISTTLTNIYTILNAVYNVGDAALQTHAV